MGGQGERKWNWGALRVLRNSPCPVGLEAAKVATSRERLVGCPRISDCSHLHHQWFGLWPSLPISHQLLLPFPGGREQRAALLASVSSPLDSMPQPAVKAPLQRTAWPAKPRGTENSGQKVNLPPAGRVSPVPESRFTLALTLIHPRGPPPKVPLFLKSAPELAPTPHPCLYAGEAATRGWVAGTGAHSFGPMVLHTVEWVRGSRGYK